MQLYDYVRKMCVLIPEFTNIRGKCVSKYISVLSFWVSRVFFSSVIATTRPRIREQVGNRYPGCKWEDVSVKITGSKPVYMNELQPSIVFSLLRVAMSFSILSISFERQLLLPFILVPFTKRRNISAIYITVIYFAAYTFWNMQYSSRQRDRFMFYSFCFVKMALEINKKIIYIFLIDKCLFCM